MKKTFAQELREWERTHIGEQQKQLSKLFDNPKKREVNFKPEHTLESVFNNLNDRRIK